MMVENVTRIKSRIMTKVGSTAKIRRNMHTKKITFGIENGQYLASTTDDSVITCDDIQILEVIDLSTNVRSAVSINFYSKNVTYKIDCYICTRFYYYYYYL